MKRLLPFLLGLLLSALISLLMFLLLPAILLAWLAWRVHERDVLGAGWERGTDCADEDVPPCNFVMTRTDTGHTVIWTWNTND